MVPQKPVNHVLAYLGLAWPGSHWFENSMEVNAIAAQQLRPLLAKYKINTFFLADPLARRRLAAHDQFKLQGVLLPSRLGRPAFGIVLSQSKEP